MTLQYLASNAFELIIGDSFHLSQNTVSTIVHRVTESLAKKASQFIKFPVGRDESKTKREFFQYSNMPLVIGAIDCTHVRIQVQFGKLNYKQLKIY